MKDQETVQRFIELRAQGWTYERLMTELNVTKPTLIAWSRKHQFEIQNLKAMELETLANKWLASVSARVGAWGQQLLRVETELARRDLTALSTPQLLAAVERWIQLDSVGADAAEAFAELRATATRWMQSGARRTEPT